MKKEFTPINNFSKICFLFLACIFSFSTFGQNLKAEEQKPLFQHLNEVNKEWSKQNVELDVLEKSFAFEKDEDRIQVHLMLVENILRKRIVTNLSPQQIANRHHHLDVLKSYWLRGVFPKNSFHNQRQPYFVDQKGTACAVGYLVKKSGATDFVEKIRQENNYAYISELQNKYPALQDWATENGFTLEELAWIQPGYPAVAQEYHEVGNGGGVNGKINVMKKSSDGNLLFMAGDFSEVDGVAANSIIAWDGENWQTLGGGVEGEIFAIEPVYPGGIYIGGNFILNDDPNYSNIAFWNGNEWEGLQEGDMEGTVFALEYYYGKLIAGGDFQYIDNQPIKYLAHYSGNPIKWNNDTRIYNTNTSSIDTIANAFSVDAAVRDFENIDGHLLVAGDFLTTAPNINDVNIPSLSTHHLAYWYEGNWEVGFDEGIDKIESVFYGSDGKLYTGGEITVDYYQNDLGIFNAGFWNFQKMIQLDPLEGDSKIHGFVEYNEGIFAYGDLIPTLSAINAKGFVQVGGEQVQFGWGGIGGHFDKQVRAAESFQDQIYFAGDFTEMVSGFNVSTLKPFKGLASSNFEGPSTSTTEGVFEKNKIQIFNFENQLNIRYENLEKNAFLHLFNLQGQIIKTIALAKGDQAIEIGLSDWAGGMYVYQVVNELGKQTGKFHIY